VSQREDGQLVMDFPEVAFTDADADPAAVAAIGAKPDAAFEVDAHSWIALSDVRLWR
jgi:hypothetical protein